MPADHRTFSLAGATIRIYPDPAATCLAAAEAIAEAIRSAVAGHGQAVLGLPTGATPLPIYARLVALHQAGTLSFARVVTYNLDEYYPISPLDPRSYRAFMHRHLFRHVDLPPNRAHLLDGTVPEAFAAEHAAQYDRWIEADGGLDLQVLGIGRNGHIGFNEPCDLPLEEALRLPTRLAELHPITRANAAGEFGGEALVPRRALTVGIAPILAARNVLVLALGAAKADPVARSLTGPMTAQIPGSLLQAARGRVAWLLDEAAARELPKSSI